MGFFGHGGAESALPPGVLHTVALGAGRHRGLYRLKTQVTAGNGRLTPSGLGSSSAAKEAVRMAFDYFKAREPRECQGEPRAGRGRHGPRGAVL